MTGRSFVLLLSLALLVGTSAGATTIDAMHERPDVGGCIRSTAGKRSWLEKTLWGLYDQERGWIGAELRNGNGTDDLGPLQVNSSWVPVIARQMHRNERDVRRWLRDDACFNVGVAAWLFLSGYGRIRDYWGAIGDYHSPTRWRARRYAQGVADRLRRRYGASVFDHQ